MSDIRIMIVDDSPRILDYFKLVIGNEPGLTITETASSGKEAIEKAKTSELDIILMDIQMETETAGIDAMQSIKSFAPDIKFIMNTIYSDDDHIVSSYAAGASDFLTKSSPITEIISTIKSVHNNSMRMLVTKSLANEMTRLQSAQTSVLYMINRLIRLTPAELQTLKLVYSGKTYREVAQIKSVEEATIRSFVNKILKKMEAKNMKSLIKTLSKMKIIEHLDIFDIPNS